MSGPWDDFAKAKAGKAVNEAPAMDDGPWADFQREMGPPAPPRPEPAQGQRVYENPVGPPVGAISQLSDIPSRLMASQEELYPSGTSPERHPVTGTPPVALPGGAVPGIAKVAKTISEGQGLGWAAGRTALATGQGAVMGAAEDAKPGESWQDKIDRVKSGAKLSGGIQLAAESLPIVGKAAGYAARKVGSALSGVDENIIKNYAARTDQVNDLIKQSGGDITEAADQVRRELSTGIQRTKANLNAQITKTLDQAPTDPNISIKPLIEKLEAAKAKLNPNFKSGAISEIDEMISAIRAEAKGGDQVNVSSLYQIKQFLNEGSASAYNKGGQIFSRANEAARAARDAANDAREMLKPVAAPISKADQQLSRLRRIEKNMNKNLIAEGKPDAALIAAGAGTNKRNLANLRALEEVSGVPATQRAQDLAAAKTFASPSLTPADWTGKSAARVLVSGGVGSAIAGPVGAAIGAAAASPMTVKLGVNAARVAERIASRVPSFAKMIRENPVAAQTVVQLMSRHIRSQNEKAPEITPEVREFFQENPKLLQDIQDPKTRDQLKQQVEPKGEDRWARSGLEKLGIQDAQLTARLMQSKEGKRLLIEASDLPEGSRALERIKEQIQKGWGKDDSLSSTPSKVLRRERKPARGR